MKTEIIFANEKIKKSFDKIDKIEKDKTLSKWLNRALEDIEENPFCGIQIPKKQIPKEYIKKYRIKNAFKYNLPNAWRLIYSLEKGEVSIVAIVLEWFPHKEYEKRFKYLLF